MTIKMHKIVYLYFVLIPLIFVTRGAAQTNLPGVVEIRDVSGNLLKRTIQSIGGDRWSAKVELSRSDGNTEQIFSVSADSVDADSIKMGYPSPISFQILKDSIDLYYQPNPTGQLAFTEYNKKDGTWVQSKYFNLDPSYSGANEIKDIRWLGLAKFEIKTDPMHGHGGGNFYVRDVFEVLDQKVGQAGESLVLKNGKQYTLGLPPGAAENSAPIELETQRSQISKEVLFKTPGDSLERSHRSSIGVVAESGHEFSWWYAAIALAGVALLCRIFYGIFKRS